MNRIKMTLRLSMRKGDRTLMHDEMRGKTYFPDKDILYQRGYKQF